VGKQPFSVTAGARLRYLLLWAGGRKCRRCNAHASHALVRPGTVLIVGLVARTARYGHRRADLIAGTTGCKHAGKIVAPAPATRFSGFRVASRRTGIRRGIADQVRGTPRVPGCGITRGTNAGCVGLADAVYAGVTPFADFGIRAGAEAALWHMLGASGCNSSV
jgi:hypothetical protein